MCFDGTKPLAGAVVSAFGESAEYLFGASSNESLDVNAGYLLHWTIAMALKKRGCRFYDLGGDSGNQGLRQFKSGMVERAGRITQLPGDFERCSSLRSQIVSRVALQSREAYLAATRMVRTSRTPKASA
jgi:lipid II:glycine glycyltransferase (peptidoglycan interpeptide bridge formation enzyme)